MANMAAPDSAAVPRDALAGVRVVEIGPVPAGTIAGSLLGDFGAEVIRVSKPAGDDPVDAWWGGIYTKNRVSLVNKVRDRNKLMATLDLSNPESLPIFRRLIETSDVLVANFRPGVLEAWGLDTDVLHAWNPKLVIALLSAYGQTGPYKDRPGDGRIAEAFGGHSFIDGEPDGPPLHSQMDMGGSLAGSWAAMGIVFALYWRDARNGVGQVIDLAAYEPMYRQIQQLVTSYMKTGTPEKRAGNRKSNGAPWVASQTTGDGKFYTYSAATRVSEFDQLLAMGLNEDPRFVDVDAVEAHSVEYHEAAKKWFATKTRDEVIEAFAQYAAAGTPVLSAAELIKDPHIIARDLVLSLEDPDLGQVRMQGVVPKFSETPGSVRRTGRGSTTDNDHVYKELLDMDEADYEALRAGGLV